MVVLIFSQQIEFTSLDLGRHLANGREIWDDTGLLFRNFYSYTEPDFRFINHHWLAGVIYFGLYLVGGFQLLSVFNILSLLAIFSLAFRLATKQAGFYFAAALAGPAIFMLSQRTEIRPEIFSYLFIILAWTLIERAKEEGDLRRLRPLIFLFAIWANIHIYFFIGLALIAFQAAASFLQPSWRALWSGSGAGEIWLAGWRRAAPWVRYLLYAVLASLINPNTWRGLLYPFNILREYGYEIAENKTVFFLENLMRNPNFDLFRIWLVILVISFVAYWLVKKRIRLFEALLALFFTALALFASRNLALFGIVSWIIASRNFSALGYLGDRVPFLADQDRKRQIRAAGAGFLLIAIIGAAVYLRLDAGRYHHFIKQPAGWDLVEGSADSAEFFKASGLSGPIFNNYDLGSALAFWLYPEERVFVDNRPEAYSVAFFRDIYRPMQTDRLKWEKYRQSYGLKTVYFSHTDTTPWAQSFLRAILSDPAWALVYFDRYTVILAEKEATDPLIIEEYEIEPFAFRTRLRELAAESEDNGRFHLAALGEAAGQPDLAVEIYRLILQEQPDNSRALVSLGFLYGASGEASYWRQALGYLSRSLDEGETLPGIYNERGLVYWNLGEYQKAAADWHTALKLERKNTSALHYLAELERLRQTGELPAFEE